MNANDKITSSRFFGRCGSVCAICAMLAWPALGQNASGDDKAVKVTDYNTVDISVQDTDLAVVLQMLSIEGKRNIITSKDVSATVTANLYDVTFEEALTAILEVNGFTHYQEGNFIYVVTKEEFQAMEAAKRKTISRIFELDYLSATDAQEFIQPLLSADGKASARGDVEPGMKPDLSNAGADDYAFTPRLVVNDYEENIEAIAQLLNELDVPPQQVLVEATILQTALDETNAFGVDFSVIGSLNFTDLTNPLSAVNDLLSGSGDTGFQPSDNKAGAASTSVGNTTGPAGLKVGIVTDDISVFLRVLDEVTDSTVLARPKVMALNRQRAQVLVGARIGYLSTTATETSTTQSVEFLDTGIQLVFRPFISKDGMIRMELSPSVSEASLRSVTDANGLIVTIPDELTNEMTTNVRIKDGQTLVLGGLFKDSTRVTRRQVPLLGDIPIVGAAFRGQDDSVERSEIIFLITPSILKDETLWARGEEILNSTDSLTVGARSGLLLFSKEKVTTNYNHKAQQALAEGDTARAMYYINNSLRVSPNQPEVIRLREQVTGEKAKAYERSLMERVFHKEFVDTAGVLPSEAASSAASNVSAQSVSQSTNVTGNATETASVAADGFQPEAVEGASSASTVASTEATASDAPNASQGAGQSQEMGTASGNPDSAWPNPDSSANAGSRKQEAAQSATKALVAASGTSREPSDEMTPEARTFYNQFLHDFFFALGMYDVAEQYACHDLNVETEYQGFPFTTFDDVTEVANVPIYEKP